MIQLLRPYSYISWTPAFFSFTHQHLQVSSAPRWLNCSSSREDSLNDLNNLDTSDLFKLFNVSKSFKSYKDSLSDSPNPITFTHPGTRSSQ